MTSAKTQQPSKSLTKERATGIMQIYSAGAAGVEKWLDQRVQNGASIHESLHSQLIELMEVRNPSLKGQTDSLQVLLDTHLGEQDLFHYGNYVCYPWRNSIVHILPENEFVEVRTNRNREKVTEAQIASFRTKKVGIVGLSVGQSIATTLAMESLVGELRLADFDNLELSNMNRLRASLLDQGLPKVEIARRAINELDPYIKVRVFDAGLTPNNLESFFMENGQLDVVLDECDSLSMKIRLRHFARSVKIPVLMETSDRGMIDVERFDDNEYSHILDGLSVSADELEANPQLGSEVLSQLIDLGSISDGMKKSMPLIGEQLLSWPQLASDVTLGGATMATCCRLIFTQPQRIKTGRRYIDVSNLITTNPND